MLLPVKNCFLPLGYLSPSWSLENSWGCRKNATSVAYTDREETLECTYFLFFFYFLMSYNSGRLLMGCCQCYLWLKICEVIKVISYHWLLSKQFGGKGPVCASYIFLSLPIHLLKWYQIKDLPHLHVLEKPCTKHDFHWRIPTTQYGLVSLCKVSWTFLPPLRPVMS